MAAISVEQRAYGISYFMTTQLIALIGWIMYWLFRRIYNKFVQAVADLEAANNRLRSATNRFLLEKRNQGEQGEETSQEDK